MLFAGLVVEQRAVLGEVCDEGGVNWPGTCAVTRARPGDDVRRALEEVQCDARVTVGVLRDRGKRIIVHAQLHRSEPALGVLQCALQDSDDVIEIERFEDVDLRPRQQRRVHLERRILGGGADQHDVSGFDPRQKGVLLRLVEAMDLVDEEERALAAATARLLGFRHHRADFLDAGQHGAEGDEPCVGGGRDQPGQRRLAGARRPPEDDRLESVLLDRGPQWPAGADECLLSDEFVQTCAAASARPAARMDRRPSPPQRRGHRTATSALCLDAS